MNQPAQNKSQQNRLAVGRFHRIDRDKINGDIGGEKAQPLDGHVFIFREKCPRQRQSEKI
ncbi:MAG: hypothetical protein NT056_02075 [Proteobacteria bacterium]|nr:hypothetical protein [Pseudomonadota bacterium]